MTRPRNPEQPQHGFRRMVSVAKVGEQGLVEAIEAQPEEREKVARYLELPGVQRLSGEATLTRWRGRGMRVAGTLTADVTQACVVTLEALEAHVDATFERFFLPQDALLDQETSHEIIVDPEAEDPPEPLPQEIDVGEILVEELALNLNPYPRKPGVVFEGDVAGETRPNPFAVLSKLRPKPAEKD